MNKRIALISACVLMAIQSVSSACWVMGRDEVLKRQYLYIHELWIKANESRSLRVAINDMSYLAPTSSPYIISRAQYFINRNSIQEEIKCRLKSRNSSYYSVQTLLSYRLLSKNYLFLLPIFPPSSHSQVVFSCL